MRTKEISHAKTFSGGSNCAKAKDNTKLKAISQCQHRQKSPRVNRFAETDVRAFPVVHRAKPRYCVVSTRHFFRLLGRSCPWC